MSIYKIRLYLVDLLTLEVIVEPTTTQLNSNQNQLMPASCYDMLFQLHGAVGRLNCCMALAAQVGQWARADILSRATKIAPKVSSVILSEEEWEARQAYKPACSGICRTFVFLWKDTVGLSTVRNAEETGDYITMSPLYGWSKSAEASKKLRGMLNNGAYVSIYLDVVDKLQGTGAEYARFRERIEEDRCFYLINGKRCTKIKID